MNITLSPDLIAPCGMNCALCIAYQGQIADLKAQGIRRKTCPGCIPRGEHCLHMRNVCDAIGQGRVRFCFTCEQFPCMRLKRLDKRYRTKYHMSMIQNLRSIQKKGMNAFLREQENEWTCETCGERLVCCHNGLCLHCEAGVLKSNKRYRWGEQDDAPLAEEKKMRYDLDLAKIPLDDYLAVLKRQPLLPSRRMLLDDADGRFARIEAQGVATVAQLYSVLSTRTKIEAFAKQSGVPPAYLTVLRREAGTLRQKPLPLRAFPGIDAGEIKALEDQGIRTSKDCFERCAPGSRLHALCGLTRINGIGPSAAAMFYAAGYRTAAEIAGADVKTMLARITAANADGRYYAGKLGEKDMRFCIEFAKLLNQLES